MRRRKGTCQKVLSVALGLCMAGQGILGSGLNSLASENSRAEESSSYYDNVELVENSNGLVLGYSKDSGVKLLKDEESGYYFKDLDKDGELDVYEDWRRSSTERAQDLASKMSLDEMLGLMLHDSISGEEDVQKGKRFNLVRSYESKSQMADYNNEMQSWAESSQWGIPVVMSTDPRHSGTIDAGYDAGEDLSLSKWPETMGMSNTFREETYEFFGNTLASEYRALGFTVLLGPQMDVITEPRWSRVTGAITEDYELNSDLAAAYIESMQTTERSIQDYGLDEGWGADSVSAIAKHWPSGGNGENGYDSHKDVGKFGVYPGDGFDAAAESFAEGAGLKESTTLSSKTAAGIMPYYTISMDQDPSGDNVGNGFSEYLVTDLLREQYDYDGVVCTDWQITGSDTSDGQPYTAWGLETGKGYNMAYRFYRIIKAGCDQIGGSGNLEKLKEGYEILANGSVAYGVIGVGEEAATERIRESAMRILRMMMNLGIFENSYTDPDYAEATAGKAEYVETAYETHLDSIVMVKNKDQALPVQSQGNDKLTVYIPVEEQQSGGGFFPGMGGGETKTNYEVGIDLSLIQKYYNVPESIVNSAGENKAITDSEKKAAAQEADVAIVKIDSPSVDMGTEGTAQNLQYDPYVSTASRETSIGYDWYHADGTLVQWNETPDESKGDYKSNRSIKGMTGTDSSDKIAALRETIELMGDKPIIVILNMNNPTIVSEFEEEVDAILIGTTVTDQAYLETIAGTHEPDGLLAVTMPKDMDSVDASCEDIPDTTPYVDSEGNTYSFGFGLNWEGQISDERTAKYVDQDEQAVEEAQKKAEEAQKRAEEAQKKAEEAQAKAEEAQKKAEEAQTASQQERQNAAKEAERAKEEAQAAREAYEKVLAELKKIQGEKQNTSKIGKTAVKKVASTRKKQAKVTWKKVSGADGYQIQYSLKKTMKNAKVKNVSGGGKSATVLKKLKSKQYYVRVRAYRTENGKRIYGAYSKINRVKVK